MKALNLPILVWFAVSCMSAWCGDISDEVEEPQTNSMTYLALGDSYTIGESVMPEKRWPNQLTVTLRRAGVAIDDPTIIARTGWTTGELKAAIASADLAGSFDLVSLLIGVNNQYRGMDMAIFVDEFGELLDTAIELAGDDAGRVIVVSIPDWGVTPFADGRDRERIAREIDAYNQKKQAICETRGVPFVNITDVSRLAAERKDFLAEDGLHPSGSMYGEWVKLVAPQVIELLQAGPQ